MPALRGSLTYARFFVDGAPPARGLHDRLLKGVHARVLRPLEPDEEDAERSGWCKVGDPFVLELAHEDVFWDTFVNLGFRTDKWSIPTAMLRRHVGEAERAYLEKKGRERLSRKEKTELKFLVAKKLRRKIAPTTRAFDLSWSLEEGIVRFFSHSPKTALAMADVFQKSFGLALVPESPHTLAERLGLDAAEQRAWGDLEALGLGEDEDLADADEETR